MSASLRRLSAVVLLLVLFGAARGESPVAMRLRAPELAERSAAQWLNSPPLRLADLRGRVVVLHFWTFG